MVSKLSLEERDKLVSLDKGMAPKSNLSRGLVFFEEEYWVDILCKVE